MGVGIFLVLLKADPGRRSVVLFPTFLQDRSRPHQRALEANAGCWVCRCVPGGWTPLSPWISSTLTWNQIECMPKLVPETFCPSRYNHLTLCSASSYQQSMCAELLSERGMRRHFLEPSSPCAATGGTHPQRGMDEIGGHKRCTVQTVEVVGSRLLLYCCYEQKRPGVVNVVHVRSQTLLSMTVSLASVREKVASHAESEDGFLLP